tara:strand:+ start:93 stop:338 length:246 start_codon:yes stop_codon:yes gene_type:complete
MNSEDKNHSDHQDKTIDEDKNFKNEEEINISVDSKMDNYNFGWSKYSEITNGRFAMIGFTAIILIELISNKSFLTWAGIVH